MKLKLLTLLLTIGLFTFGADVNAQTPKEGVANSKVTPHKENLKGFSDTVICMFLKQVYGDTLPTDCQEACPGWVPNPEADKIRKCAAGIAANQDKSPKVKTLYNDLVGYCDSIIPPYCTMASCTVQDVRNACGNICCNIKESTVTNCMAKNGDNCSNYKYAPPPPVKCDPACVDPEKCVNGKCVKATKGEKLDGGW